MSDGWEIVNDNGFDVLQFGGCLARSHGLVFFSEFNVAIDLVEHFSDIFR